MQERWGEIQTIVGLSNTASRYPGAGHHPDGVRRDTQKTPMIPAGVRKANVEIPMVGGEDMKICLDQGAPPPLVAQRKIADSRPPWYVVFDGREIFRNTNHAIRIAAAMRGFEPFALTVPG